MAPPSTVQDGDEAAAVLRRLAELHHLGELSLAGYRRERRRLLEAVAANRPIPEDLLETSLATDTHWGVGAMIAVLAMLGLVLAWWLSQ